MTPEELDAIEARAKAATPGPRGLRRGELLHDHHQSTRGAMARRWNSQRFPGEERVCGVCARACAHRVSGDGEGTLRTEGQALVERERGSVVGGAGGRPQGLAGAPVTKGERATWRASWWLPASQQEQHAHAQGARQRDELDGDRVSIPRA